MEAAVPIVIMGLLLLFALLCGLPPKVFWAVIAFIGFVIFYGLLRLFIICVEALFEPKSEERSGPGAVGEE